MDKRDYKRQNKWAIIFGFNMIASFAFWYWLLYIFYN